MITRQQTQTSFPSGIVLAVAGGAAVVAVAIAAVSFQSNDSSPDTSSNTSSALSPWVAPEGQLSESERLNAEMQQHEDLTTNEFGPIVVPQKSLEDQVAEAIAEHENGLAAQLGR